jgi:hypothetical protein
MRLVTAAVVLLVIAFGLGAVTRWSWGEPARQAELRLSWRTRSEPVRTCRQRTADELARLPVHMREEEVCETRSLPYRLRVTANGAVLVDSLLAVAGRGSRPLYVSSRIPLEPGVRALRVEFAREGAPEERAAPTRAMPTSFVLDTSVTLVAERALIVTFDDQRQRLRVIAP